MRKVSWFLCGLFALAILCTGGAVADDDVQGVNLQVRVEDGKVTVIGPDGEKRQFDVEGADQGKCIRVEMNDGEISVDAGGKKIDLDALKKKLEKTGKRGEIKARAIIIGPDGKKKEIDLAGGGLGEIDLDIKKFLPKEALEQLGKAKKHGKVTGKAIIIGPDGKKKEIDLGGKFGGDIDIHKFLPKEALEQFEKAKKQGKMTGKAIIIGPDGKKKEIDLKGGNIDIDQFLPKDAREQLEKAFQGQPGDIQKMLRGHAFGAGGNRPMIGIALAGDDEEVRVAGVRDDSPGAKAGLRKGDVVLAVNKKAVESPRELMAAVAKHKPGDEIKLKIRRGDKELTKEVTLGSAGKAIPERFRPRPDGDLKQQIQRLEEQNRRLMKRIEKLEKELDEE